MIDEAAPFGPNTDLKRPNARQDWLFEYGEPAGFFNEGLFYEKAPRFMPPPSLGALWTNEGLILTVDPNSGQTILRSTTTELADGAILLSEGVDQKSVEYQLHQWRAFEHGTWRTVFQIDWVDIGSKLGGTKLLREVLLTDGTTLRFPMHSSEVIEWDADLPISITVRTYIDPLEQTQWLENPSTFNAHVEAESPEVLATRTRLDLLSHATEVADTEANVEGLLDRIVAVRMGSTGRIVYLNTLHRPKNTQEFVTFNAASRAFEIVSQD